MRSIAVDVLLFAGVAVLLLCALGILVMDSAYDLLHYASAAGWGALLIALAIVVRESLSLIGDKALLTAAVLVVCGPVLSHATARAGRIRERGAWNPEPRDRESEAES
ncbi:MAG TPA: monovalent cation/H(+) antiporter subunit G [Solirubrobacteraceae bacterium]|jgi:multicomponent Na+:H+ antiporter subunit G